MGKHFSRVIYIRRDTIHQGHSMLASSIGTSRPVIVLEIKYRTYRPLMVLEVKFRAYRPVIVLEVKYRTYRSVIVLEVKYRGLQACDSPGREV